MPSPLGHGLGALAAGIGGAGAAAPGFALWRQVALLALIGMAPDLDLLWGRHSRETHSVGAALLVAALAAWQRWPVASTRGRIFVAVFAAWLSHAVLDTLSMDTSVPIGVQVWWPFSQAYVTTGLDWFGPISRRYWLDNFWTINLASVTREVLLLGPVAMAVWWARARAWAPRTPQDLGPRRTSDRRR